MKTIYGIYLLLVIIIISGASCVSKKKFKSSQARIEKLHNDSTTTHTSLNECLTNLNASKNMVSQLDEKNLMIIKELQELSTNSQMTINQQAKRLADMQKIINSQKSVMNNLMKTVTDALVGFTPEELNIQIKDGNIYVSLQEKLLFKSGSDKVDPKGKEALQKLAAVLNSNPDINVNIEGHTDSIPIKGKFADNWALSVARATSIVRILTIDAGVNPHRIIASGRSEFYPVDSNSNDTGRAHNRRTEIILSPNLSELFKLLNQ